MSHCQDSDVSGAAEPADSESCFVHCHGEYQTELCVKAAITPLSKQHLNQLAHIGSMVSLTLITAAAPVKLVKSLHR